MERLFFSLGAILGFFSVGMGAFGAHALKTRLAPDLLNVFETGVRYQMYHALALLAVAWALRRSPSLLLSGAGWLFVSGTLIFSGSLYALALSGARGWGAVTPIGGLLLLSGWVCLAMGGFRR